MSKYIAKSDFGRYKKGEELRESDPVCKVLELQGKAEKVERKKPERQQYSTRDMAAK